MMDWRRPLARVRHFVVAWLRNLEATRLLSGIAIVGLTIGLTGAILMSLVARIPLGYNQIVPDHDRTYLAVSVLSAEGMAPNFNEASPGGAAALITLNVPEVEAAARLAEAEVELRRGGIIRKEKIYWGDPNIFDLLRLPVLHGDVASALRRADGIVMTEASALKHFGRSDAVGETIEVGGQPMTLRAVLADFPPGGTDLAFGIIGSGLATQSKLAQLAPDAPGAFSIDVRTYLRLRPSASALHVERSIARLITGLLPAPLRGAYAMELIRIDRLALHQGLHPGARERLIIGSLVAALVLLIATANFVNLSVALSGRRRREIAVRKVSGASRSQIAVQFLGESILTVLIAAFLAVAATEWLLPSLNAALETNASFDYVEQPRLILWLLLGALLLGAAAGAHPALLISSARPVAVFNEKGAATPGGRLVRSALVLGQFAILIGLMIATAVVYQQRLFATNEALRVDVDQMLTVAAPCPAAFVQEVEKLRGVRGVSCSGKELLTGEVFGFVKAGEQRVSADLVSTLPSTFALYGVRPLAGSLATLPAHGEELVSRIVINETAARRFGYPSPAAAIGKALPIPPVGPGPDVWAQIVAVVPDFGLYSIETAIEPTIYLNRPLFPGNQGLVSVKLAGRAVPETIAAIDRLWRATGHSDPIDRAFVSDHLERLYRDLTRNAELFAIFSGLAIFLACLGLVGLSVSAAERRTKEIGIRKAMGASTSQIMALLLAQLSRPLLLANVIAWPVAWWLLRRWLNGFAYHVPLNPWLFPAAGLLALTLGLMSVGTIAYRVARRKPVYALRYE